MGERMPRYLVLVVALAAWPAPARAQNPDTTRITASFLPSMVTDSDALGPRMSLATVIEQTTLHSPDIVAANGAVRTSRSAQRVAIGNYLPDVSLNGIAVRSNQVVAGASGQIVADGGYGGGVNATVPLFTGGFRGAVRRETNAQAHAADAGLVLQQYSTILQATVGYFEVLRGHALVHVATDGLAVSERGLSYARTRAGAGTVTPSDVLRAQLAVTQSRRQLLAAYDTLNSGAAALGRLVGADGLVDAEPPATLDPTPLALPDSEIVKLAATEAPAVLQADQQQVAAKASIGAARSQYFPQIFAGAGYNVAHEAAVPGALRQGWILQLGASLPLFNGFQREDSVTRAEVSSAIATSTALDTRRVSRAEALRLLGNLHVAEQDVKLTREAVQVAGEDLRVITVRYRAGIATILDQVTSQQNVVTAQLALVSAQFTYHVARAALEALLGREL